MKTGLDHCDVKKEKEKRAITTRVFITTYAECRSNV